MVIQGNRPYDGTPVFFLILCIVIAVIAFIVLIIKICRYKKKKSPAIIAIFSILLLCSIGGIIFIGIGREAQNDDIYIDLDQKISLNMNYEIYAYENIDDLEITFYFADKNGKILCTKVKQIGDVKRNNTYYVSIKFTEFGFAEILNIEKTWAVVTGGRTSYI